MIINFSNKAKKLYKKLPLTIKKKADKQLKFIRVNPNHPSLNVKKMQGFENRWEARIDLHYRFTFEKHEDIITLRTIGPHDEGLGKK
ncbi:MAG: hypothetical protein M1277_01615 [Patescibacteria group bacterium]|nr:hypothetical protein [Patescibacteria group bacterium]